MYARTTATTPVFVCGITFRKVSVPDMLLVRPQNITWYNMYTIYPNCGGGGDLHKIMWYIPQQCR